jgi:hypothetical protein
VFDLAAPCAKAPETARKISKFIDSAFEKFKKPLI